MKRLFLLLVLASVLSFVSCTDSNISFCSHENTEDLVLFEKKIASSYYPSTRSNPDELDYQLIGFTTITFSADEQEVVKNVSTEYSDSLDNMGNVFVAKDGSFVRIYYPLRNAIVKIKGKTIVADENGRLPLPPDVNLRKTRIIGREKTERSSYTTFNVKIFPTSQYIDNNVLVFELGYAPDGTTPTAAWFADGRYLNTLPFRIDEEGGSVTIGLEKTEILPNDYEVVGAWHLYYLGDATGIDFRSCFRQVEAGETPIYNLQGQRLTAPQHGINIIGGKKVVIK